MFLYESTGEYLYFSVLNLVSHYHFFYLYLYINAYQRNKEITNDKEEICSLLMFTVFCHVIIPLLAVLQER